MKHQLEQLASPAFWPTKCSSIGCKLHMHASSYKTLLHHNLVNFLSSFSHNTHSTASLQMATAQLKSNITICNVSCMAPYICIMLKTDNATQEGRFCQKYSVSRGAFHCAKPTGQRSVGIPEENGTTVTFPYQTGPTNRNGSCHFLFLFQIS